MRKIIVYSLLIYFCLGSISCSDQTLIFQPGKEYKTTVIDSTEWTAENLDVIVYNNGDTIPHVELDEEWQKLTSGAWCYYLNDDEEGKVYGKLYNWYAINDPRGLAPDGYKIPAEEDFDKLVTFLCGSDKYCGGHLKARSDLWFSPNTGATDLTGFTALPSGHREQDGTFRNIGLSATYWATTESGTNSAAIMRLVHNSDILIQDYDFKGAGFAVRLIKE